MRRMPLQEFIYHLRYQDVSHPKPEEIDRRQRFLRLFPDQEANLISYQDNPNCSCVKNIMETVGKHPNLEAVFTEVYREPIKPVTIKSVVGTVVEIDIGPEAWAIQCKLHVEEMWQFRGLFMLPIIVNQVNGPPTRKMQIYYY